MLSMSGIHFFPCWVSTKRLELMWARYYKKRGTTTNSYSEFQWIMMDCVPSDMTIWCHLRYHLGIYLLFQSHVFWSVALTCGNASIIIDEGFPGGALIQPCGVRVCTKSSWDLHRYRVPDVEIAVGKPRKPKRVILGWSFGIGGRIGLFGECVPNISV